MRYISNALAELVADYNTWQASYMRRSKEYLRRQLAVGKAPRPPPPFHVRMPLVVSLLSCGFCGRLDFLMTLNAKFHCYSSRTVSHACFFSL